jgi:hypothetical protein
MSPAASQPRVVPPLAGWPCHEQAAAATNNSSSIVASSPNNVCLFKGHCRLVE